MIDLELFEYNTQTTDSLVKQNLNSWNKKVEFDIRSDYYSVTEFKKKKTSLNNIELELLGDVRNKSIIHLQCYFGLDTLSLANLGAKTTGLDFCPNAISYAKQLSSELNIGSEFICSNVYDMGERCKEKYDIVYASYGAICWLPDLNMWAKEISNVLKPGGQLIIVDFHPILISFDLLRQESLKFPYFNTSGKAIKIYRRGTYADSTAPVETIEYNWNHSIAEILSAFTLNGFEITEFDELPYIPKNDFPNLKLANDNYYHLAKENDMMPFLFSLKAVKKNNG